jgi:aspartyl protease family protein
MTIPPFPELAALPGMFWPVAGILLIVLVALRLPVIGKLLRLGITLGLLALLALTVSERERFDPYLQRLAGLLKLDSQQVTGNEVRIRMAPDGHFWARVRLNGLERRMLVDSGATVTALSARTAKAAGLEPRDGLTPMLITTANGTVRAQRATVEELRLGAISAPDTAVIVSPAFGEMDVLGMNFLSRLKSWRVEDGVLVLVPHRPQPRSSR